MSARERLRTLVIGAGSWGTALAWLLARNQHRVQLWCRDRTLAESIRRERRNPRYLSDCRVPAQVELCGGDEPLDSEAELVVLAVPVQHARAVLEQLGPRLPRRATWVCASKGIERHSLLRVSEIVEQLIDELTALVALSGPSFAVEVIMDHPTAVTVASRDEAAARRVQRALAGPRFRVYTSDDVVGVEVAGALKNVIAIAAGIIEGLGLGRNSVAALITRGLAEITRLGVALGGRMETFLGLAGVGDLVLTTTGELSRNRRVGVEVGKGRKLEEVLAETTMVAEGVETSRSALALAEREGVELPITRAVTEVLFAGKDPAIAVRELMTRRLRAESWRPPETPGGEQ